MIQSMTGFVRTQAQDVLGVVSWEIRSVNHRYLDLAFKLPERFRSLEAKLRELAAAHLSRGRVECQLRFQSVAASESDFQINEPLLQTLQQAYDRISTTFKEPVALNFVDLLRWPGVMQVSQENDLLDQLVLDQFEVAMQQLIEHRAREGEKLKALLEERLTQMQSELKKAHEALPSILVLQKQKLQHRFEEAQIQLDAERVEQEMVLLAQKIDVSEELDRLALHIEEVNRILAKDKPCGRRLDFLMQEFNREANTLGSKSISDITTTISLELKVLIEQMREQVQNIE